MSRPAAQLHDAPTPEAGPAVETVRFPQSQGRRDDGRQDAPVPTEAASLAAIERRLGELVRTVRLALVVAVAWLLWQLFGDGIEWLVSLGLWTAGTFVLIAVAVGVTMYVSPGFRRGVLGGAKRLFAGLRRRSARRR